MDGYAITYGLCLALTALSAILWGRIARRLGVAMMVAAWVMTLSLQWTVGEYSPVASFASVDFLAVVGFCLIGLFYQRRWAIWVGGIHVLMLLAHLAYLYQPVSEFMYLSILAGLGYLSMIFIGGPPVYYAITGREWDEGVDRPDLVHRRYGYPFNRGNKDE